MDFITQYNIIAFLFLSTTALIFLYVKSLLRLKQSIAMTSKLLFLSQALEQYKSMDQSEEVPDIHKENFIKFLSDSRDWAFEYIEEVQNGLSNFIKEVEPDIDYYNKYGAAVEGMMPAHDKALKKISAEFEKLKTLLPEEKDDKR